jgi:hypothetical protein
MDGDDILVSTIAERGKARAVRRDPNVSLCILNEHWPPSYLLVCCKARIVEDFEQVVDLRMRSAGLMAGKPMPEAHRPFIAETSREDSEPCRGGVSKVAYAGTEPHPIPSGHGSLGRISLRAR